MFSIRKVFTKVFLCTYMYQISLEFYFTVHTNSYVVLCIYVRVVVSLRFFCQSTLLQPGSILDGAKHNLWTLGHGRIFL